MKCRQNVRRLEEICEELMDLIDDSRAHDGNDSCELICCVVHDAVQKMQRAVARWSPEELLQADRHRPESAGRSDRNVN